MDICDDLEAEYTYAMQLATSIALPMVLLNAVKLKVLETIADAGLDAQLSALEITTRLSISNDDAPNKLDRMLQLLASYSIVTCTQGDQESKPVRVYGLMPIAKHFIPNEDGLSFGSMMDLVQDDVTIKSWFKLKDSVTGMKGHEYMASDPRFTGVFSKAMEDTSTTLMKEILKDYDGFNNLKTLVDVGGGLGGNLYVIVSKHKNIKGINFDLPNMICRAPQLPGVEHVAGDMFDNVPHGDAIFLKWIVHGWGDDDCVKFLKNCYKALPNEGKVIIVEKIVSFLPDTSSSTKANIHFDALRLTLTHGGKERTEKEFLTLAIESGFSGMKKKCFKCTFWAEYTYAFQLATSIALPMVLSNAIKLKVLETLADAGSDAKLSAHEIATRLAISDDDAPNKLDRMLQLLASYSVVTCTQGVHECKPVRVYGLASVAKHFMPNEYGASFGPMMDLMNDEVFKIKDSVVEGGTALDKVTGMKGYEYFASDPRFLGVFNNAMKDTSTILMTEILKDYDGFDNLKTLVDVGGGLGGVLYMIVSKHKHIKGINFDLPNMISRAPQFPGVEHVAGDMFESVPQGDAIFLKWIVHGWGDEDCIKFLKNCYKALPDDGKVIIVEKIVPFLPDTNSSTKTDVHLDALMLCLSQGGMERTEEEFLALAIKSGFSSMKKKCFKCTFWVIEFYK
ncbi:hypothetical protein M8C21_030690 [Ambrosia artemisiifolia]|uniref:Caffeic acid 3-O-methyltransferase n=1 Tax=Ambrosia artemisiifolia TaxID=4212 RepID=A0AAD5C205_AMBAR|nr:hypothetical protein M8C21_030690 [Ambrosia artemisiifolia]